MKALAMLGIALLAAISVQAHALTIRDDHGGRIDFYLARAAALRHSSDIIRVDGPCNSACTLLVSAVPASRVCVTKRASLGFHSAWQPDGLEHLIDALDGTAVLGQTSL